MSNPIDRNKFNTIISEQASDAIMCNSKCRKQREADKLQQNYFNAQTNLNSASNQVQVAQKNYVTFTKGESAYNDLLDNELEEKAQIIADKFTENFEQNIDDQLEYCNLSQIKICAYEINTEAKYFLLITSTIPTSK